MQIWQKKRVNQDKFETATKQHKSNIKPMCILFLPFDRSYMILTYFASFTGFEDVIFEVVSNFHIQGSTLVGKFEKFGGKSVLKLNSAEFIEFVFSWSDVSLVCFFLL